MDSYKGDAFEMTSSGILTGSQLLVASRLNSFRCKLGVLVDSGHCVDCFFPLDGTVPEGPGPVVDFPCHPDAQPVETAPPLALGAGLPFPRVKAQQV